MKEMLKRALKCKTKRDADKFMKEEKIRLLNQQGMDPQDSERTIINNLLFFAEQGGVTKQLKRVFASWLPKAPQKQEGNKRKRGSPKKRVMYKSPIFRYRGGGWSERMIKWIKMGRPPMWERQAAYYGKKEWAFLDLDQAYGVMRLTVVKRDDEAFVGEGRDVVVVQNYCAIGSYYSDIPPSIFKLVTGGGLK